MIIFITGNNGISSAFNECSTTTSTTSYYYNAAAASNWSAASDYKII